MHNILHFCGMLSSLRTTNPIAEDPHESWYRPVRALPNLADVSESDSDDDRETYLTRLGMVLQLARKHAGISQEKAAQHMGLSTATFTRWEAGDNGISAYDLVRLIRLYDFDPDLAVRPPASKAAIKRRLGPIAPAAARAVRRAQLRPLPSSDAELE